MAEFSLLESFKRTTVHDVWSRGEQPARHGTVFLAYGPAQQRAAIQDAWTLAAQVASQLETDVRVKALELEVSRLAQRLAALEANQSSLVVIEELGDDEFCLSRPVSVAVEVCEDSATAHHADSGVSASGDNLQDAVQNLKNLLVDTFLTLSDYDEGELSEGLIARKLILQRLLKPAADE